MSETLVLEYIDQAPENRKEMLYEIRSLMRSYKLEESMDYKMPTYSIRGMNMFAFASQKNYISLYVMLYDLLEPFEGDLKRYNTGKSCIRFKRMLSSDMELIAQIVHHCVRNFRSSTFFKPELF